MIRWLFCIFVIMQTNKLWGQSDVSFVRTDSADSKTNRIKGSTQIHSSVKLIAAYSQSELNSSTYNTDSKTNSIRLGAKYNFKNESSQRLHFNIKRSDETYNFVGSGWDALFGFDYNELSIGFRFESLEKTYEPDSNEKLSTKTIEADLTTEPQEYLTVGGSISFSAYSSTSNQMKRALEDKTTSVSDINSYTSSLIRSSQSIFVEYEFSKASVGLALSRDVPALSNQNASTGTEIYTEYFVSDSINLFAALNNSRTIGTTNTSQSTSLGMNLIF